MQVIILWILTKKGGRSVLKWELKPQIHSVAQMRALTAQESPFAGTSSITVRLGTEEAVLGKKYDDNLTMW